MENLALCSACSENQTQLFCVCTPSLPVFCSDCEFKHKAASGFHYFLPLARLDTVTRQNQRQFKLWLLALSDAQQSLRNTLDLFTKYREDIVSAYGFAIRQLEDQRDLLLKTMESLQAKAYEAVNAAIEETQENCLREDYQPTSDCAELIWKHACAQLSEEIALFCYNVSVSEDAVRSCVSTGIDFNVRELASTSYEPQTIPDPPKPKRLCTCGEELRNSEIKCGMCEAKVISPVKREGKNWKCLECGRENSSESFYCLRCGSQKPEIKCGKCTRIALPGEKLCSSCKYRLSPPVEPNKWACKYCRTLNSQSRTLCIYCLKLELNA